MVRFSGAALASDWVVHCEQHFWACLPAWALNMNSLPHCQLSHMAPMDRPAGIERASGGKIAMAYRDDIGIFRNRVAGNMHATFRWKPLTGALALECLDMDNHLHAWGDRYWVSAEWSSVQHPRQRSG